MTTNIWIRPGADVPWGSASYGTGDGSSYANAFAGLQDTGIDWGIRDLQVWICGVHAPLETSFNNVSHYFLSPVTGGSAYQPTIIRGDDPNEAGRIWGGQFYPLTEWTAHPTYANVYQLDLPRADAPTLYQITNGWLHDVGADHLGHDRLVKQANAEDVRDNAGSYYATGTTGGSTVYVRLADDADPSAAHRVLFPARGYRLKFDGIAHTVFRQLDIFGTRCTLVKNGISFIRCTIKYAQKNETYPGIMIGNNSKKVDDVAVYRCNLGSCSYGAVYTTWVRPVNGVVQPQPHNWFVALNLIEEVGAAPWNEQHHPDDHGIGIQNCDTFFAYGNIIENTGPGIVAYAGGRNNPAEYMRNVHIRRNMLRGMRNEAEIAYPRGIEHDGQDGVLDCTGNVIAYNVVSDMPIGPNDPVSYPGAAYKFADVNPQNVPLFEWNVARNVPDSIYTNGAGQYMTVTNFTSLAPTAKHVRLRSTTANATFTNNTYAGGPGGDEFKNGVTDYTWAEWQSAGYDAGSSHS